LKQHWDAAGFLLEGKDIYVSNVDIDNGPSYVYPPLTGILHLPFALLPFPVFRLIWYLINMGSLLACIYYCKKLILGLKFKVPSWMSFLSVLLILRFVQRNFDYGQINIPVFALLLGCMSAVYYGKNLKGAFLLSLAASIKIFPLMLFGYFLFKLKIKFLVYGMLFILLLNVIIPAIYFGPSELIPVYKKYVYGIQERGKSAEYYQPGNQSLFGALSRFLTDFKYRNDSVSMAIFSIKDVRMIFAIISLILLMVCCYFSLPKFKDQLFIEFAMFLCLMFLAWQISWIQNFILLLLPHFVIMKYISECKDDKFVLYSFIIIMFVAFFSVRGMVGGKVDYFFRMRSHLTFVALIEFLLLIRIKLKKYILGKNYV
jgi:hypothetical protein